MQLYFQTAVPHRNREKNVSYLCSWYKCRSFFTVALQIKICPGSTDCSDLWSRLKCPLGVIVKYRLYLHYIPWPAIHTYVHIMFYEIVTHTHALLITEILIYVSMKNALQRCRISISGMSHTANAMLFLDSADYVVQCYTSLVLIPAQCVFRNYWFVTIKDNLTSDSFLTYFIIMQPKKIWCIFLPPI